MRKDAQSRIDKILDQLEKRFTSGKDGEESEWSARMVRSFHEVFGRDDSALLLYCIENGGDWIPVNTRTGPLLARLPADRLADIRRKLEWYREGIDGLLRNVSEVQALDPAARGQLAKERGWPW